MRRQQSPLSQNANSNFRHMNTTLQEPRAGWIRSQHQQNTGSPRIEGRNRKPGDGKRPPRGEWRADLRIILAGAIAVTLSTASPLAGQSYPWTPTSRTVSGGESDGTVSRSWAPGLSTGYFTFSYDFYGIPDSAFINFGGQQVFSTGGYVSGSQTVSLSFGPSAPGVFPLLNVVVNPAGALPGTAWTYTLTPSARPVLESLAIAGPASLNQGEAGIFKAVASYTNGSTRVVLASWTAGSNLRLSQAALHADIMALPAKKEVKSSVSASYIEDGVTKKATAPVTTRPEPPTNNPDTEKKTDPSRKPGERLVGGAVDTATGAESFYRPLITLHGSRDIEFGLYYSSTFSGVASPVGYGWSHSFGARTSESGEQVSVHWSATRVNVFTLVRASSGAYYTSADPDARLDVLAKTADGGFTLTKADQTRYSFRPGGALFEIRNPNGQVLDAVSDSAGIVTEVKDPLSNATLTFTYSAGRMTRIQDHAGRGVVLAYSGSGLLTSITDPDGRTTGYGYNSNNKLATVTAPGGTVLFTNTYDTEGRVTGQSDATAGSPPVTFDYNTSKPAQMVTTVTDRLGGKVIYTYDASKNLISLRDASGRTTSWAHNDSGLRTQIKDPLGRITTFEYDQQGNPVRVRGAAGDVTTSAFDSANNLVSLTNPAGHTTTYRYDVANRLVEWTNPDGGVTRRTFDGNGLLATETSPRGGVTQFTYANGRLTQTRDSLGGTAALAYDAAGRLVRTTYPGGASVNTTISAAGNLQSQTDPAGRVTTFTYNVRGMISETRDPLGGVTTVTYDGNGRLTRTTNPLGNQVSHSYDAKGRLASTTDARGGVTSYAYDPSDRLVSVTNALGAVTRFSHDAAGNVIKITDPTGAVTETAYSPQDRPTVVKDPLGRTTATEYDALGRVTRLIDPLGRSTGFAYDSSGSLVTTTTSLGVVTSNAYDSNGNRISLTEPLGGTHVFAFDSADRETASTNPLGRRTGYTYDARGLLTGTVSPAGRSTAYQYDGSRRITRKQDAAGTATFVYDGKGRRTSSTEAGKTLSRQYDAANRLTQFTDSMGNTIRYDYDATGNITRVTHPDGRAVAYEYDLGGRLVLVTDWAGRRTTFTYDAADRLTRTSRPNGTQQQRRYDSAGQLVELTDKKSDGSLLVSFAITYDKTGQVSSIVRTPAVAAVIPPLSTMGFDAANQLTTFDGQPASSDADSNLTSGPLGAGVTSFAYDARQRLTSAGADTLYFYDCEDRRIEQKISGAAVRYVNNPAASLWQTIEIRPEGGIPTYAVHGNGLLYTESGGQPLYHHYDPRGNTVITTDQSGAITYQANYDAFGNRGDLSGQRATPFLFAGQFGVMTEPNGLIFSRARYYNPQIRRFLNPDPIGQLGGMNLFAYAGNNPVLGVDPSGQVPVPLVTGAAGALVGGAAGGLIAWWRGENVAAGMAGGAAGGFLIGSGAALIAPAGTAITAGVAGKLAVVGVAGGVVQDATQQGVEIYEGDRTEYSVKQTLINGAVNGVTTPLLAGAGGVLGKWTNNTINRFLGSGSDTVENLIKSGVTGEVLERVQETFLKKLIAFESKSLLLQSLLDGNRTVLTPYLSNWLSATLNDLTNPETPPATEKGSSSSPAPTTPIPTQAPHIPMAGESKTLNNGQVVYY